MRNRLGSRIKKLLQSSRGVAVSLLEATATIAVGAILGGAAILVVSVTVQQAKIARAGAEVKEIANALTSFQNDMLHYPIFFSGAQTGPTSPSADIIRSNVGAKAEIGGRAEERFIINQTTFPLPGGLREGATHDLKFSNSRNWNDGDEELSGQTLVTNFENQLNSNKIGYVRRGGFADAPNKGWNGPYFEGISPTDPWGNKYYVNSRFLNPAKTTTLNIAGQDIKVSVFVLSAGPNETIQTPYGVNVAPGQTPGNIKAQGDDIVARVR